MAGWTLQTIWLILLWINTTSSPRRLRTELRYLLPISIWTVTSLLMKCSPIPQVSHGWFFQLQLRALGVLRTISCALLAMGKDGRPHHQWRTGSPCQDGSRVIYIFNAVTENVAACHEMCARLINLWKEKYSPPNDYILLYLSIYQTEKQFERNLFLLCVKKTRNPAAENLLGEVSRA